MLIGSWFAGLTVMTSDAAWTQDLAPPTNISFFLSLFFFAVYFVCLVCLLIPRPHPPYPLGHTRREIVVMLVIWIISDARAVQRRRPGVASADLPGAQGGLSLRGEPYRNGRSRLMEVTVPGKWDDYY